MGAAAFPRAAGLASGRQLQQHERPAGGGSTASLQSLPSLPALHPLALRLPPPLRPARVAHKLMRTASLDWVPIPLWVACAGNALRAGVAQFPDSAYLNIVLGTFEAVLRQEPSVGASGWAGAGGCRGTRRATLVRGPGKRRPPCSTPPHPLPALTTAGCSCALLLVPSLDLQGGLTYLQKARKCGSISMAERFQVGGCRGCRGWLGGPELAAQLGSCACCMAAACCSPTLLPISPNPLVHPPTPRAVLRARAREAGQEVQGQRRVGHHGRHQLGRVPRE